MTTEDKVLPVSLAERPEPSERGDNPPHDRAEDFRCGWPSIIAALVAASEDENMRELPSR